MRRLRRIGVPEPLEDREDSNVVNDRRNSEAKWPIQMRNPRLRGCEELLHRQVTRLQTGMGDELPV